MFREAFQPRNSCFGPTAVFRSMLLSARSCLLLVTSFTKQVKTYIYVRQNPTKQKIIHVLCPNFMKRLKSAPYVRQGDSLLMGVHEENV
jgi:hypothetical protein